MRGLLGILSGLICWASLCWGINALLPFFFPKMFNSDGTTDNFLLNLLVLLFCLDFSFLAGLICARIGKIHERRFAFVLGLLQLGVALYVYQKNWLRPPLGFSIALLTLMLPAAIGGAVYETIKDPEDE